MTDNFVFCADSSREADEPLAGTGSQYRVWMLLEYRPNWHPKAVKPGNNSINAGLQTVIHEALNNVGDARMLFIRQLKRTDGPLKCFFVFTDDLAPRMYALDLNRYEDLLSYSLPDILSGRIDEKYRHDDPIYTVCVHKERDRCCGMHGWSLYNAMKAVAGEQVWQSTHIGGHRFAGTMLAFPQGTYYGHMDPDDGAHIIDAESNGHLYLPKLRGRSCYAPHVQAAEAHLRETLNLTAYGALRLKQAAEDGADTWRVIFGDTSGGTHTLRVVKRLSDFEVFTSTGNPEPEHVTVYNVASVGE